MSVSKVSLLLLIAGVLCIVFENSLYQYVDENGVLHESLFLPLGVICLLVSGIGFVFVIAKKLSAIKK